MSLPPNSILEGLRRARQAVPDVYDSNEVMVDDQGDHWVFEFILTDDTLGGGARVTVAKEDYSILKVVQSQ